MLRLIKVASAFNQVKNNKCDQWQRHIALNVPAFVGGFSIWMLDFIGVGPTVLLRATILLDQAGVTFIAGNSGATVWLEDGAIPLKAFTCRLTIRFDLGAIEFPTAGR